MTTKTRRDGGCTEDWLAMRRSLRRAVRRSTDGRLGPIAEEALVNRLARRAVPGRASARAAAA